MLRSQLDHIALCAPTLQAGVAYIRNALGVEPQPGGRHPRMGTHNALLKLGAKIYLEVIAPDPDVPRPERPRWFALDTLASAAPARLATWVVRTGDIRAACAAAPLALGAIEPMSRGPWQWLITIPADGSLPLAGIAPSLIQWHGESHPAASLPESGCRLLGLEGFHPRPQRIEVLLEAIGFAGAFQVLPLPAAEQPHLVARIATPAGERRLG